MIRISINRRFVVFAFFTTVWLLRSAVAQSGKTGIDMPFQLTNGHIKTPAFKVKGGPYLIELIVKTDLSYDEWCCAIKADKAMGASYPNCAMGPSPRIQARWTLWDGTQLVDQGPSEKHSSDCQSWGTGAKNFHLGGFQVKGGKTYVLDVEITNVDPSQGFRDAHLKVWPAPDMYP
jgi:hypothetical protein